MSTAATDARADAEQGPRVRATVSRDFDAAEALRARWMRFPWRRVDADIDFFTTFARANPKVLGPHVISIERDGDEAMVIGRIEETVLATTVGYKAIYRPRLRLLVVAHGGVTGEDSEELSRMSVQEVRASLRRGEADAALLPAVRVDSPLHRAAQDVPLLGRQQFAASTTHWAVALPGSMDAFLKSRSKKVRENARVYGNRLRREFGDRLTVELLDSPGDLDRIVTDLSAVAAHTYQSRLGVAFADTPARRQLTALGLERRWFRAYVMYLDGRPIAFWPGYAYARTFFTGTPGYSPEFAKYSIGTVLLLRVIDQLCDDQEIDVLDFGFGDADYKRRFGTTSWDEADVLLFAPTFKGIRLNLTRTAILAASRAARGALERTGLAGGLKKRWRRRLRPS